MSFITKDWAWLKKEVNIVVTAVEGGAHTTEQDIAKIVVIVVEEVQSFLKSGTAGFLESVAVELTKSNIPTEIVNTLNAALPDVLAAALAVEGLPKDATTTQVLIFETTVLAAFGITSDKSKVYTETGAVLLGGLDTILNQGTKPTFGQLATLIESAFQTYRAATVAESTTTTTTDDLSPVE